MKINIYVLQRHTMTGETRERFLIDQNIDVTKGIWLYSNLTIEGKKYQVREIRNTKHPLVLDVLCLELPAGTEINTGISGMLENDSWQQ